MCQINHQFLPRKPRFDFDMLEMFFSFQFTKYDEKRWLNTKLFFLKRDVIALKRQYVYSALLCDWSLQMGRSY